MTATSEQDRPAGKGCESCKCEKQSSINNNFINAGSNHQGSTETSKLIPSTTTRNNNTPLQSPSSTTTSSKSTTGHTTSLSKFKEKRPEPLNLNPSLNQEIPLDLSVKSAGNVPSGGNIFNLVSAYQMTTLETPRIVWHENEAMLLKQRLFSSSTGVSHRIRISSLAGDSPPMTPSTPYLDALMNSPTSRSTGCVNSSNILHGSTTSLHSLMSTQLQHKQHQFHKYKFDDSSLTTRTSRLTPTNKLLIPHLRGNDFAKIPRRSCSIDNLSAMNGCDNNKYNNSFRSSRSRQQSFIDSKKSSISPLVLRNLSSSIDKSERFSYNSQLMFCCNGDGQGRKKQFTNLDEISVNNVQALTPTSVANATKNLLNIHLNSPTSTTTTTNIASTSTTVTSSTYANSHKVIDKLNLLNSTPNSLGDTSKAPNEYRLPVDQNLDPLLSASYCNQNCYLRSPSTSTLSVAIPDKHSSTSSLLNRQLTSLTTEGSLTNVYHSYSSNSTTLNTPTLISPSQLKTGFLPSPPTLSPMSSVFELPSPLLMFPPPTQNNSVNPQAGTAKESRSRTMNLFEHSSSSGLKTNIESSANFQRDYESSKRDSIVQGTLPPSITAGALVEGAAMSKLDNEQWKSKSFKSNEVNLTQLVTPATDKMGSSVIRDEEVDVHMSMDLESMDSLVGEVDLRNANILRSHKVDDQQPMEQESLSIPERSTAIPTILVSDCPMKQQQQHKYNPNTDHRQLQIHTNQQLQQQPIPDQLDKLHYCENEKPLEQTSSIISQGQATCTINQQRVHRDTVGKRALSPRSFRTRVNQYYNERLESSSAPPNIYEVGAKPKTKSAAGSCVNLQPPPNIHHSRLTRRPAGPNLNFSSHYKNNAPYPGVQPFFRVNPPLHSSFGEHKFPIGIRPSSAEPYNHFSSGQMSTHNQQHSSLRTIPFHQQHQQQQQPERQYELSMIGYNFSHSAQHLNSTSSQFSYSNSSVHHQQQQSISLGELNRNSIQIQTGTFIPQNGSQQIISNQSMTTNSGLNSHNQLHNSTLLTFHDLIHQPQPHHPLPPPSAPPQPLLNSNQGLNFGPSNETAPTAQGETIEQFQIDEHSQQPRALSADIRGLSRSESSCSSADFCFRSISATSSTTAKKYQCNQCSKAFTRSDMLTRHKRLHTGDRPFQCNECKQEFSRSDHLSTHMRTHTGEKPYKCKLCSYSACRKDMITRHMKVHNRSSPNSQPLEFAR